MYTTLNIYPHPQFHSFFRGYVLSGNPCFIITPLLPDMPYLRAFGFAFVQSLPSHKIPPALSHMPQVLLLEQRAESRLKGEIVILNDSTPLVEDPQPCFTVSFVVF